MQKAKRALENIHEHGGEIVPRSFWGGGANDGGFGGKLWRQEGRRVGHLFQVEARQLFAVLALSTVLWVLVVLGFDPGRSFLGPSG